MLEKICLVYLSVCGGRRLFPTLLFDIGALPEPAAHSFELSSSSFYVDAGNQITQVFMLARQALYTLSISKTPESDGGFFGQTSKNFLGMTGILHLFTSPIPLTQQPDNRN